MNEDKVTTVRVTLEVRVNEAEYAEAYGLDAAGQGSIEEDIKFDVEYNYGAFDLRPFPIDIAHEVEVLEAVVE